MLEEILEQPAVVSEILKNYVKDGDILIDLSENVSKLRFIASGSSYHAASILKYMFKENTCLDVDCEYSSEFVLRPSFRYDQNTFYIFISQSGETSDTLSAMKKVKLCDIKTMTVTNVINSSLWNEADYKMLMHAGKEVSVASTKAFSAQVLCLYLVMLKFMKIDIAGKIAELTDLPADLRELLNLREKIGAAAKILSEFQNVVVLGNREYFTVSLEGALKIKETSYININAYPTGEFLHGHVAVLNNKAAVIALIDERNVENNLKYLRKIHNDYNGTTIITVSDYKIGDFDFNLQIPKTSSISKIFNLIVMFQLLAYETAKLLGRDIDSPKGLSKVVLEQ